MHNSEVLAEGDMVFPVNARRDINRSMEKVESIAGDTARVIVSSARGGVEGSADVGAAVCGCSGPEICVTSSCS